MYEKLRYELNISHDIRTSLGPNTINEINRIIQSNTNTAILLL